jgi:hypothetical protein
MFNLGICLVYTGFILPLYRVFVRLFSKRPREMLYMYVLLYVCTERPTDTYNGVRFITLITDLQFPINAAHRVLGNRLVLFKREH